MEVKYHWSAQTETAQRMCLMYIIKLDGKALVNIIDMECGNSVI